MRCCCAAAESAGAAAPEPGTLTETIHGRYPRLTWREHAIVTGLGAAPRDSMGNPWNANYIVSSGNLLADMRFNVTAESQGRLQVARLYQLTQDAGVRDMFSFLLARDTMHQNQWLAAIEELKADGLEETPVPSNFPQEREMSEVAYRFMNFSEGKESQESRWAGGPSKDDRGEIEYVAEPQAMGPEIDENESEGPKRKSSSLFHR